MSIPEYDRCDATGLARLVRRGEVTPLELLDEAIRRTEALNAGLNAVVTPMYDLARAAAAGPLPDGPFRGVPFLLKDLLHAYAGVPMSCGSRALRDFVPAEDSELVRRYRRAGLVAFGKTNTPEFGLMGVTEPEAFGPTRNPWDPSRTSGGSSGGSGAAVAAGFTPIASAGDGGGSIRIPASCCGLFGLKPSRGRVPVGPAWGEVWDGANVDLGLTRSVRDSAVLLDAVVGPDPGAPYEIAPPERPYAEEIAREPRRLRIAYSARSPLDLPVDPECVAAVHSAVQLLQSMGHEVEEAAAPVDGHAVARAYLTMYFGQTAAEVRRLERERGRAAVRLLEASTRVLANIGKSLSAGEYVEQRREWNTFARAMATFHQRYDVYLTPTLATLPPRIGALAPGALDRLAIRAVNRLRSGRLLVMAGIFDKLATENLSKMPFTQLANLTGQPAMSVPLHWSAEGLPVGVHFMAPSGDEATLFRLAARLEEAAPWMDRRPPLVVALNVAASGGSAPLAGGRPASGASGSGP